MNSRVRLDRAVDFTQPEMLALLAGKKDTFRVVACPPAGVDSRTWEPQRCTDACLVKHGGGGAHAVWTNTYGVKRVVKMQPRFRKDGLLWVRETWGAVDDVIDGGDRNPPQYVVYRADHEVHDCFDDRHRIMPDPEKLYGRSEQRWCTSVSMPRWASRFTLTVEDIQFEELCEITDPGKVEREGFSSVDEFEKLWDSRFRKRGDAYFTNPFVWVVTFRAQKRGKLHEEEPR